MKRSSSGRGRGRERESDSEGDHDSEGEEELAGEETGGGEGAILADEEDAVSRGGVTLSSAGGWLQGRGVGVAVTSPTSNDATCLSSLVLGPISVTNKLVTVSKLSGRYEGQVRDVVVGVVVRVGRDRWTVDLGQGAALASLPLASVNLPSGAQRRRTEIGRAHV